MTERERCPVCDFPLATLRDSAEADDAGKSLDVVVAERRLCWEIHGVHAGPAVDWRARALKAEADKTRLRDALERLTEDVACLPVDFCDEDEEREAEEVLTRARAVLAEVAR